MNTVNTIEWMLAHKGIAVARIINNNKNIIEIIEYSEDKKEYPRLKNYAKSNNYIIVIGKENKEESRLGYFRD